MFTKIFMSAPFLFTFLSVILCFILFVLLLLTGGALCDFIWQYFYFLKKKVTFASRKRKNQILGANCSELTKENLPIEK